MAASLMSCDFRLLLVVVSLLFVVLGGAPGTNASRLLLVDENTPPPAAYIACVGHNEGDHVTFAAAPSEPSKEAVCVLEASSGKLVARPADNNNNGGGGTTTPQPPATTVPPTPTDDQPQLMTMAFDCLAFLTGTYGLSTFLPPGKVTDYFSFQYMRDVTADGMGHNTHYLTRIAGDVWLILSPAQKTALVELATTEYSQTIKFARLRLPIIQAFITHAAQKKRSRTTDLNTTAVLDLSAALYEIDGASAFHKAQTKAEIIKSFSTAQEEALKALGFADYANWPDTDATARAVEDVKSRTRDLPNGGDVAANVLGYVSELFSWYKGDVAKDAYFCPERHAMYFGGFGYKTLPGKGQPNYSISTGFTADGGEALMDLLTATQKKLLTGALAAQRDSLMSIVAARTDISTELRKFLAVGSTQEPSMDYVVNRSKEYGRYDGKISVIYANAFASINQTLTTAQRSTLASWRDLSLTPFEGPFLYANEDPTMVPAPSDVAQLFNKA